MFFDHPGNPPGESDPFEDESDQVTSDLDYLWKQFQGVAPLFPLGNLTLLPNVVQPFHMFEPRYRELAEDAVEGDGFIALAILNPQSDSSYESKAAGIFPHVCLGKITQYEPLPEGRWNLIVRGLWRASVDHELDGDEAYRRAALDVMDEPAVPVTDATLEHRDELVRLFKAVQPKLAEYPVIKQVLAQDLPLGLLTDFVAHALDLSPMAGASLLEEADPVRRCAFLERLLATHLRSQSDDDRPFPPPFSVN